MSDPTVQQGCAAIFAAVLRRDPVELREMWRLVATAAACWWAGDTTGVSSSAPDDYKTGDAEE